MIDNVNKEYPAAHKNVKIRVETDEMRSFYGDKPHQIRLRRAAGRDANEVIAYWPGSREHKNLDRLIGLLEPIAAGTVFADGSYACFERFDEETPVVVSKKNTQKIERKHLALRTRRSRLVRKGVRFSKTEQMHKTAAGLVINLWFFGNVWLIQYF